MKNFGESARRIMNSILGSDNEIELSFRLALLSFIKSKHITLIFSIIYHRINACNESVSLLLMKNIQKSVMDSVKANRNVMRGELRFFWVMSRAWRSWFSNVSLSSRRESCWLSQSLVILINVTLPTWSDWFHYHLSPPQTFTTAQSSFSLPRLATLSININCQTKCVSKQWLENRFLASLFSSRFVCQLKANSEIHPTKQLPALSPVPSFARGISSDTTNLKFHKRFAKLLLSERHIQTTGVRKHELDQKRGDEKFFFCLFLFFFLTFAPPPHTEP